MAKYCVVLNRRPEGARWLVLKRDPWLERAHFGVAFIVLTISTLGFFIVVYLAWRADFYFDRGYPFGWSVVEVSNTEEGAYEALAQLKRGRTRV